MNSIELAWAAGFFDGEGHVGYVHEGKHKGVQYYVLRLSVAQHHSPEVLERFRDAVGVGKIFGPYIHPNRRSKNGPAQYWSYVAQRSDAGRVIDLLFPLVSSVKADQMHDAMKRMVQCSRKALGKSWVPAHL